MSISEKPDPLASIETAWETALIQAVPEREPAAKATFWASSLGMCVRKQIAQRAGIAPTVPLDRRSRFKLWTGKVLGFEIAKALEASGFLEPDWTEKRLELGSVSGRVDGFTKKIQDGAIVEVKTADDRAVLRPELPEHYLWQAMWYCLASSVPRVVILMVGKNQGLVKHQVVTFEAEWRQRLTQHISELDGLWELYQAHHTLPGHEHRFAWEDRYCSYLGMEEQLEARQTMEAGHGTD